MLKTVCLDANGKTHFVFITDDILALKKEINEVIRETDEGLCSLSHCNLSATCECLDCGKLFCTECFADHNCPKR